MFPAVPVLAFAGVAGFLAYEYAEKQKKASPILAYVPTPTAPQQVYPPVPVGEPRVVPQVPPIQNIPGLPRTLPNEVSKNLPIPVPKLIGKTLAGNAIVSIGPIDTNTGRETVTNHVATQSPAIPAAHALYDYLVAKGTVATPQLASLTMSFQQAYDADRDAVSVGGQLATDGVYDLSTSGALTVYTGHAIPPAAGVPRSFASQGPGSNGDAAITASNLYAYLKINNPKRGTSPTSNSAKDPKLKTLVQAFQHAVNTDSMFPGPACPYPGPAMLIKTKLDEDGVYGPKTADALAVASFERVYP